ncbi:hypothetical protein D3H65_32135 [Paraflavitalea soli]|uniref:Uncharacterized protein n=1 Tax=Paraflavitalea soli TaxID=2315862 RepID=A0A3B7MYR9_9BACT|nr:hypothetical protein [Paraflavitalea soli]AXY78359.1 hypothetical protein D3H65_32135 [Paraflavitalea soli]
MYRSLSRQFQEMYLGLGQLVFILQFYEFVFCVAAALFGGAHAALSTNIMVIISVFYGGKTPHTVMHINHHPTGDGHIQNG